MSADEREDLARIIALTYKMQPHSMLNAEVPLLIADAILAAGFARISGTPGVTRITPQHFPMWAVYEGVSDYPGFAYHDPGAAGARAAKLGGRVQRIECAARAAEEGK